MAYTVQKVFDIAVGDLIGKRQADGTIDQSKVGKWKARTLGILTAWQNEMAVLLNVDTPDELTSMADELAIDAKNCAEFYLASNLLLVEDPASSSFYNSKYEENRDKRVRKQPAIEAEVTDSYYASDYEGW